MIKLLWDASQVWGYLAAHALNAMGVDFDLLKASDIAQGGLSGKLLLTPGGPARSKFQALGSSGSEEIRQFVHKGGAYVGFCGGAGLALAQGLALCPWSRADMGDRLQHLVSGHVQSRLAQHPLCPNRDKALLPVWWPGRFQEIPNTDPQKNIDVLARYQAPGPDLHVADLPLAHFPAHILADWENLYGVRLRPSLLDAQPCIISGEFGQGRYVLSYSHLETPDSPAANDFFATVLEGLIPGLKCATRHIAQWNPAQGLWDKGLPWEDPTLRQALLNLEDLFTLVKDIGLLFERCPWLLGWKSGVPGAACNHLRLALYGIMSQEPGNAGLARWHARQEEFSHLLALFLQGAESWFLARRLADTLSDSAPGILPKALLQDQRGDLFGGPMSHGGLCGKLCDILEKIWLD